MMCSDVVEEGGGWWSYRSGEMSSELTGLQLKTEARLKDKIKGRLLTNQQAEKGTKMNQNVSEGKRR